LRNIGLTILGGPFVDTQLLAEKAIQLHRQGRAQEADALCLRILAANPNDFTASYMLGVTRFREGRLSEALRLLDIALAANSMAAGPLIYRGLTLQALGQGDEALACFDQVLAADENLVEALVNRANVLSDMARYDEALVSYDKALGLKRNFEPAWYNRGNALRALRRFSEALASFERALAIKPDYIDALNNRGSTLQDMKDSAAALASFDQVLSLAPYNVQAHYNRGTALQDLGRHAEALAAFDRALALMPGFAAALNSCGAVLMYLKRPAEALASFDKALGLAPDNADALSNRGNSLRELKRWNEALESVDRALALQPGHGEALNNRGIILRDLKRLDEALSCFDQALAVQPANPQFRCNRGVVLLDRKNFGLALEEFDKALGVDPGHVPSLYNRGHALRGLHRLAEAMVGYTSVLAVESHHADAFASRGDVLRDMGHLAEALQSYDRALAIAPDNVADLNNRASVLQKLGRHDEALEGYDRALRINPGFIDALYNRGNLLWLKFRRFEQARRDLEKAARINPDYDYLEGDLLHLRMQQADWRGIDEDIAAIISGVREGKRVARPFVFQAICDAPGDLQAASILYAGHRYPPEPVVGTGKKTDPSKIRLGYVCDAFREQATSFLAAGLYERHDKSRFEIFAFDTGWNDGSPLRRRLEAAFGKFIDLSRLTDRDAAERIAAEGIDVLVNLNGYFGQECMGIFAHRPAPIQVNYLGFPATLGAPYMDYILADRIVIPENERQFYTEQVVWLPDTYQVNDSRRPIADAGPSRAESGLPEKGFVFCNFNNIYKLTPAMFAVWMDILRQTEGSVLWLLESNREFPDNLRKEATRLGVAAERLVFAPAAAPADHLARMKLADLFLDSIPYNAHTTASDALWAGLPLLTCRGNSFPGRVAASLLHAIGLPELVTASLEDYQALALRLAGDPGLLAAIRQKLADNRLSTALFDTDRFRRHIESAYTGMWEIAERGESPRGFSVEPVS
jgi:predicted O-linked N-acetylglucosamine transferase (SPINDLY family)